MDPHNAKAIVAHVADVLSDVYPQHSDEFRANADALTERLGALDDELDAQLRPLRGKPYVVFHDAYQYFEKRYGLTPSGSVKLDPHKDATPGHMSEIREKIRDDNVLCVFHEPQFSRRAVDTAIEGTDAKVGELDPIGNAARAGSDQYFELMRGLARNLTSCLS